MKCRDIKRHISAYLDGELPPCAGDAFFDHLQTCQACCDLVGEASFGEAIVANTIKVRMTAPVSLRYNVLSAISREKAHQAQVPASRRFAWRPATAMAAVLALAGAGWRSFNIGGQPGIPVASNVSDVAVPYSHTTSPSHGLTVAKPRAEYVAPTVTTARPVAVSAKPRSLAVEPGPSREVEPAVPTEPKAMVALAAIGRVTDIYTGDKLANGRFLSRIDGKGDWKDAPSSLSARTHLQTTADTIVTLELLDGTVIKTNQQTDFVIQRSPSKDDPSWEIRLVRGELWVKTSTNVKVVSPSLESRSTDGEFSVRCLDGEDSSAIVVAGLVACHNSLGTTLVGPSQASVAASGQAPREAFSVEDARSQMDWVYAPSPAHNPQDDGGTQS